MNNAILVLGTRGLIVVGALAFYGGYKLSQEAIVMYEKLKKKLTEEG